VYAALLSHILSDLAHDLGSPVTAEASAIDTYQNADQAGHDELAAWACSSLSTWAIYAGRPTKAVDAAERGIERAPRHSPIAARLYARAARGYALQGNRAACTTSLALARALCEQLPDQSPCRLTAESCVHTASMVTRLAAACHVSLSEWPEAEHQATATLSVAALPPGETDLAHVHLAIALAQLGSPVEAVEHGKRALSSARYGGAVHASARELDTLLMSRHSGASSVQEFHEQYQLHASRALSN